MAWFENKEKSLKLKFKPTKLVFQSYTIAKGTVEAL
jgi:hypothetical protein